MQKESDIRFFIQIVHTNSKCGFGEKLVAEIKIMLYGNSE